MHTHRLFNFGLALLLTGALLGARITPPPAHAQDDVGWLLAQINDLRGGLGLHPYGLNTQLSAAAYQHSLYMVETCDVSHTESNGSTPTSRARAHGYTGSWISENIYMGGNARAVDAWNFWLNSGIHYQGMTHHTVNEIGIGVAYGACGQGFTLLFGYRADVDAPPAPAGPASEAENAENAENTGSEAAEAAAPAPTQVPYVPPPPTRTPTPTIPTLTPSQTWTVTPRPTETPAITNTPVHSATPTATPLILPTVPALELPSPTPFVVAQANSPTPESSATPSVTPLPTPDAPTPTHDAGEGLPGWLPVLLLGAAGLLGIVGIVLLRKGR